MKSIAWIGSIALLATSCGQQVSVQPSTSPDQSTLLPSAVAPATVPVPAASVPAASATVAVPPAPPVLAVPDLIPPTSAEARVAQVNAGRSNPYATTSTAPRVTSSPTVRPSAPVVVRAAASSPAQTGAPVRSAPVRPAPLQSPAATNPPRPVPVVPTVQSPVAVPSPTATIARTIGVSGVVQTSRQTSAIVEVPQEGSRYVTEGDRVANGRVLVRRIEAGSSGEATVIFEQDGVEVSRSVGSSLP